MNNRSETVGVPPFNLLTVTAGSVECTVFRVESGQDPVWKASVAAGQTQILAPTTDPRVYRIDGDLDEFTYVVTPADMCFDAAAIATLLGYTPAAVDGSNLRFGTADPQVAGQWWDNSGTLTKSTGT